LAIIATAYVGIIEPLITRRAAAQSSWEEVSKQTAWLEGKKAELAQLGASRAQLPSGSPQTPKDVAALEAAIKSRDFAESLTRIAPQNTGKVELVFAAVSYLSLMEWMLQSGLAQGVDLLTIKTVDAPDKVDTTIIVNLSPQAPAR
jgi:type II secretory pathway component PulM